MYTFSVPNQSPFIVDVYNKCMPYKTDGFLVEIGVGHTIEGSDWLIGNDPTKRMWSNTADLLDLGWSGIYVDPVKELCDEAALCHKGNTKLKIINMGCSDTDEEKIIYGGESFTPNDFRDSRYAWIQRKIKCSPTSTILSQNDCPMDIDVMSIDVEGYEEKVLMGLNIDLHRPKILIIEYNICGIELLVQRLPGYTLLQRDYLNAAFILN